MALRRFKLSELIKQRREKYDGIEVLPIKGVSREGFMDPKQEDADTSIYNVFYLNDFVFNPARMELNSIALNTEYEKGICSSLYEVFYVSRNDIILPLYLNIFIKREEFARKCWFHAIGSARNYFRVPDLGEFEIDVPDIPIQEKFVKTYLAMLDNQKAYERGLDDLKLVCDFIIESQRVTESKKIRGHLIPTSEKNIDSMYTIEKGVSIQKKFIDTKASSSDIRTQKVIKVGEFAFNTNTSRNSDTISIALNEEEPFIVSNTYGSFKCDEQIIPQYLYLWFRRKEFDRFARFNSWGSAREIINIEDIEEYEIAIPSINEQMSTINLLKVYQTRRQLNERLKQQIKDICPILIKGSIEEAKEA